MERQVVSGVDLHLVSQELWLDYEREVWTRVGFSETQIKEIGCEDPSRECTDAKMRAAIEARYLVAEFHNRHVGLTCGLAYRLTRLLQRPALRHEAQTPWREVLIRLDEELTPVEAGPTQPGRRIRSVGGILLSEAPIYVLYRLVMPLIQMSSCRVGECFLASAGAGTSHCTVETLLRHDARITEEIVEMTRMGSDSELALFWVDRAFALAAYSGPLNRQQLLPDPDPLSAALFYRLDTVPDRLREYETVQRLPARFRQRRARRRREEGLSGIITSRSPDDVDHILQSELTYPLAFRADRLLNTGYLVTEHQPRRERLRDALIVGFLPPQTAERGSRAFVKTCWFNMMMVLAQVLFRHRLFNSEFWWIEGDALKRHSATVFALEQLKEALKSRNEVRVLGHSQFRRMFLNVTRWQPAFLDPDKAWFGGPKEIEALAEVNQGCDAALRSLPTRWILSTALTQHLAAPTDGYRRSEAPQKASSQSSTLGAMIGEYAFVHFATFLPAGLLAHTEDDPWGQAIGARLKACLGLVGSPFHNLSITWLTRSAPSGRHMLPPVSRYLGRFYRNQYAWSGALPEGDLQELASKLEKDWLDEIVRELQSEF